MSPARRPRGPRRPRPNSLTPPKAASQAAQTSTPPRISPVAVQRPEDDTRTAAAPEPRAASALDKHPRLEQYTQAQFDALEKMRVPKHALRVAPASAVNKVLHPDGSLGTLAAFRVERRKLAQDALAQATAAMRAVDDLSVTDDDDVNAASTEPDAGQLLAHAQELARGDNELRDHEKLGQFLFIPTTDGKVVYFACDVAHHPDRADWSRGAKAAKAEREG